MAGASGYAATAGFESICEALYFGLPVYAVPVEGHFEQACNALDARRAGAAMVGTSFDLDGLRTALEVPNANASLFRAWIDAAGRDIVETLEGLVTRAGRPRARGGVGGEEGGKGGRGEEGKNGGKDERKKVRG